MYCYITFKLPFIPAFFSEHVCFSTFLLPFPCVQCLPGSGSDVICVSIFSTLILTFVLEAIIFVLLFDNFID